LANLIHDPAENLTMKRLFTAWLGLLTITGLAGTPGFTIDASHSAGNVSPRLYGLMTEEINHSYDGGLYAELIQNRAFQDNALTPVHWSAVQGDHSAATLALDPANPLNGKLARSLRVTVTAADKKNSAGAANDGYWGIPATPKTTYRASVFARAESSFSGPVTVAIVSDDGKEVYATGQFSGLTTVWKNFEVTLKTGRVTPTAKAHFAITLNQPGTVWLGFVSLFPPTWNNQPNGFRKDLMQMMVDLHPKFLRCPGGNYVEGNTVETRFDWKKTIGPLAERPGHACPWGYRSSDGLGLLEFLQWCEAMKAEPVLAVYAGYSLQGAHVNAGAELQPFVQDALDEIEYVTGDANTRWGAERAKDGHPAPFPLNYVEIGNEDWFDKSGSYEARFAQFYDAIKAQYPHLKTISTYGDDQAANTLVKSRKPDAIDGHYYRSVDTFLKMSPDYANKYDRSGPELFVGEWAAYETSFPPWDQQSQKEPPTPRFEAAIGDAVFLAAMERNSDLIKMQCYAPMFVNVNPGARQWRPNLIGYDAISAYGSPSYYAIQMFSRNLGDQILATASVGTSVQGCATRDSQTGEIIVKLVNPEPVSVVLNLQLKGVTKLQSKATAITLSGGSEDMNSIQHPRNVKPVSTVVSGVNPDFSYPLPANSIVVLKLKPR
jgi:alpha-N-arabinofuranosidase